MRSKVLLFVTIVLCVIALMALAWWAVQLPSCEDPPNAWMPCLPTGG